MAERVLRSPGVTTRELDLSAPGRVRPQGIPAGIIGTAQKGPAFVPVNFATVNDFANLFGGTEGKHFGAMAVNEWMRNARSGLFLRVLGVGDGQKAQSDGHVKNAGFVVGLQMRDKDRTTAGGVNPTDYADMESDGSADIPIANPYAGEEVESSLTSSNSTENIAGNDDVENTAVEEAFTLTLRDQDIADGNYILYEAKADGPTSSYFIFWFDGQINSTARTANSLAVEDGGFPIWDANTAIDANVYGTQWHDPAQTTLVIIDATHDGSGGAGDTTICTAAQMAPRIVAALEDTAGPHPAGAGELYGTGSNPLSDGTSPVTSAAPAITIDLATAIEHYVLDDGTAGTDPDLSGPGFVTTADAANNIPSLMAVFTAANAPIDPAAIFSAVTLGELEVTLDPGTGAVWTLAFDANIPVPIGSTYVLTGADNTTKIGVEWTDGTGLSVLADDNDPANGISYQEINASGVNYQSATWSQSAAVTDFETAIDTAFTQVDFTGGGHDVAFVGGMTSLTFSSGGTTEATATMGRGTDPTAGDAPVSATLLENSPNAPGGRVYFLAARSSAPQDEPNDYLAGDQNTFKYLLRGVLMFPSGVLPGIEDTTIVENQIPSAAFGTYGTGKDQGESDGLGTVDSDGNFVMALNGFTNDSYEKILTASFETTSPIYLSKVFNTDPTKIQEKGHYLYAHYDVPEKLASVSSTPESVFLRPGAYYPADGDFSEGASGVHSSIGSHTPTFEDWRARFSHAYTPWIQSQTLGESPKKLFKFHMLDAGKAGHGQIKISIANIQKSTDLSNDYGSFDVQIRAANDTDLDPQILQQFSGVNLNPSSDRYIARVIGDQNTFFEFEKDPGKQKLVTEGLYPNNSQYVRVEVNDQVESGQMEASALPLGFQGKNHLVLDGQALSDGNGAGHLNVFEPPVPFRESVSIGEGSTKVVDSRFYWGIQNQMISSASEKNRDTGVISLVDNLTKWYPDFGSQAAWVGDNNGVADGDGGESLDADVYNSNAFSLENLWIKCLSGDVTKAVDPTMWHEAVYIRDGNASGEVWSGSTTSFLDADGNNKNSGAGYRYLDVAKDFGSTASKKFFKFTVPMQGGFDGLDILDQDKANMNTMAAFREMDTYGSPSYGGPDGSTTAAFRKALDILAEKSDVDIQLLATPGMRSAGITDYAIDKTEDRFDALYIMDMPAYDHDGNLVLTSAQETSVTNTAQELANRNLDTSFAATYFPDLVIADGDNNVVAPPSVAVLGALSLNDSVAHPWYAPAGFARGALASTIETAVKLNRTNMDVLYDSDINPITSFPQTGSSVVVFGQKTMLQAQSALDRVNVRRLLIDVRRKVRTVANQVLFEPNRESTLARFSALVNPILGRIQQQQGLDRYKVIIDTTTTTQQDVENNTIRGKIFLQPTRSIEFISLDFVVTNAGAEI